MTIPAFDEIIEPNDQTEARAEHLEAMRELVGNVYPNKFDRSRLCGSEDTITAIKSYAPVAEIAAEMAAIRATLAERERPPAEVKDALNERSRALGTVRIAGRVTTPPRGNFVHLTDGIEKLQIYCDKKNGFGLIKNDGKGTVDPEGGWAAWQLVDHGDFIGVEGYLFITNTGEVSVHVERLQFLAKAMLPMPDKMHGIADPELRRRYRYVDLIGSSLAVEHEGLTTRETFERRAKIISSMRRYLEDHGYIEVETPMLTPKATGAAAEPFETYHKALDIQLFARIAPELYLKRLMVGGFEKVYELNRNFRNEGLSHKHNPEFTMLEFYCAYMDVNGMMDFCEEMLKKSMLEATGGLTIEYEGNVIDFGKFERVSMKQAVIRYLPKDPRYPVDESWFEDAEKSQLLYWVAMTPMAEIDASQEKHISPEEIWDLAVQGFDSARARDESNAGPDSLVTIFEEIVEEKLIQPTFIIDYPKSISPLSKASPENPAIAERFELFIGGIERANGFSELNDPKEQYDRFVDQMKVRETGDAEAMVMDEDYIKALSYGMPPAAGIGIGIDRIVMLLTNQHSIRDVILFPHMRPERNLHATEDAENTEGN